MRPLQAMTILTKYFCIVAVASNSEISSVWIPSLVIILRQAVQLEAALVSILPLLRRGGAYNGRGDQWTHKCWGRLQEWTLAGELADDERAERWVLELLLIAEECQAVSINLQLTKGRHTASSSSIQFHYSTRRPPTFTAPSSLCTNRNLPRPPVNTSVVGAMVELQIGGIDGSINEKWVGGEWPMTRHILFWRCV